MSVEALGEFQRLLFFDRRLQDEFREISDQQEFADRLVEAGRARNLEFSSAQVREVLDESRRQWIQRWIG